SRRPPRPPLFPYTTLFRSKTYLADDILVKVDRMSMAHALEVRAPFLDHRVVEFVAALPADLKLRGRTTKFILREAMRPVLPGARSEEHTSELQSRFDLVCR